MSEEQTSNEMPEKDWYKKHYKKLLIISALAILISVIYLGVFISQNGDIIYKDVSLTGGTTITVFDKTAEIEDIKEALSEKFPDLIVRQISDFRTRQQQGFFVETSAEPDEIRGALEEFLGYDLNSENSSTEFTGASLSSGFYQQLRTAIIIAFIFMALVVFLIFRTPIPSLAVIASAFADIVMTLAVINLLGISVSSAGIVAILMLIGYSVDTDIMLTSRILRRREGSLNERMMGALKTGLTMTLTSLAAVLVALLVIYNFSDVLRQMFVIISIGLVFDIFNTWVMNASILRWYALKRGLG